MTEINNNIKQNTVIIKCSVQKEQCKKVITCDCCLITYIYSMSLNDIDSVRIIILYRWMYRSSFKIMIIIITICFSKPANNFPKWNLLENQQFYAEFIFKEMVGKNKHPLLMFSFLNHELLTQVKSCAQLHFYREKYKEKLGSSL